MKSGIVVMLLLIALFVQASEVSNKVKVFIDYEYGDLNYIKENITCIDYVRYVDESEVYILITKQRTGSDGKKYSVDFTGKKQFSGIDEELSFILQSDDTDDDERRKSVQTIKLGLIRYLSRTDFANELSISFPEKVEKIEVIDNWNNWVYSIGLSGFFSGQESSSNLNLWGNASAKRVTENTKIQFRISGSINREKFDSGNGTIESRSDSRSFNTHLIKAWTGHLSYGLWAYAYASTYSNIDLGIGFYPGIEYNYFPYSESNKKQLRFQYYLSGNYGDYIEETIYEKLSEYSMKHTFTTEVEFIRSWGSAEIGLNASQYLIIDDQIAHHLAKNKLTLSCEISWRIIKGLSFDIWGNASRIHDQLSLPAGNVSTEELLLKRKELQTEYTYFASVGLSYSFGSIYNNIINSRFGD